MKEAPLSFIYCGSKKNQSNRYVFFSFIKSNLVALVVSFLFFLFLYMSFPVSVFVT